jgi:hypothetical protein
MAGQAGFFDLEERPAGLSRKGDDLERLNAVIDFNSALTKSTSAVGL